MSFIKKTALTLAIVALGGCEVGPDYTPPSVETPAAFKERGTWQTAQPQDAIDRGAWWSVYKDPILDNLERQIDISNQNLKAAEAAYRQATALVDQTRAGFFPTLSLNGSAIGSGALQTKSVTNSYTTSTATTSTSSTTGNTALTGTSLQSRATAVQYNGSADLSWSLDIWGRIRRTLEANESTAEADAADIEVARLSAQATLATDYFNLRTQDDLKRLLAQTVEDDTKILRIIENQLKVGVAAEADVLSAQTQLESVQASLVNADVLRSQYEHAIAVLIGQPPSTFTLTPRLFSYQIPNIPAEIPSVVLQRRPDIAAAERAVAAANAEIGVADAAYYPDLTLSGSVQSIASQMKQLLNASNVIWSVGPAMAETVIDWGARDAAVDQAKAGEDQAIANYRQTVLAAFQNVEDNLASQRILSQQAVIEDKTVADARESENLTLNQYKQGIIPYNTVLVAQTTTLTNEETALSVTQSRLVASVNLIEALGGGWDVSKLSAPLATPTQPAAAPDATPSQQPIPAAPAP